MKHIGKKKNILGKVLEDHGHEVIIGCESGILEKRLLRSILVKADLEIPMNNNKNINNIEELFLIENITINGIYYNCRKVV